MRPVRLTVIALVLAAMLVVPAVAAAPISISGSTSVYPLMTSLVAKFKTVNSAISFAPIKQGGSDIGVSQAAAGTVSIGMSSRDHESGDPAGLAFVPIARDAICIVTNKGNPVTSLSQKQVQQVFSGQVRTWSGIPGAKTKGAIHVITRTASSGTADAFQNIFMGQDLKVASNAAAKASNGLVQLAVAHDTHAIGFVSLDFIKGIHPIGYQGVACTLRTAKAGSYAGVRTFYVVTKGLPTGDAATFINWIRSAPAAEKIIETHWLPKK